MQKKTIHFICAYFYFRQDQMNWMKIINEAYINRETLREPTLT